MKKFLATAAVVALVALAVPAFAATNPFMDVPSNHWARDAISQLAANGIISGYPDGTYRGAQPTTRFEMASALARALNYLDFNRAGRQDIEMMKKLVLEFKDELDAMGVRVDELDDRVSAVYKRLGGWKISGVLRQDIAYRNDVVANNVYIGDRGYGYLYRARLLFDRWFGEDEGIHFQARIDGQNSAYDSTPGTTGVNNSLRFQRWFAEVPFHGGTTVIVGRYFNEDLEYNYYINDGATNLSGMNGLGTDSWMHDRVVEVFALRKSFGMGTLYGHVSHPTMAWGSAWEVYGMGSFQFMEHFAVDLGVQSFWGDDASVGTGNFAGQKLKHLWTGMGGLRFTFGKNIILKGMFYYQDRQIEDTNGNDFYSDSVQGYKGIIEVKQDFLKFTSLWLEYVHAPQGFWFASGGGALFNEWDFSSASYASRTLFTSNVLNSDLNVARVAARQQWNSKWATFLFAGMFDVDLLDAKFYEYGGGINYRLNPNVDFGLTYVGFSYSDEFGGENESQIRFRTQVSF